MQFCLNLVINFESYLAIDIHMQFNSEMASDSEKVLKDNIKEVLTAK